MVKSDHHSLTFNRLMLNQREAGQLSPRAAFSEKGFRRRPEPKLSTGYRQAYAVDGDRILHSRAYTRYIDKTQVFFLIDHDHITHRVLHVQLVSKIGRTIGRFLSLNEDLIEAIALGHDIGHAPFGHDGEQYLSDLCRQAGIGFFQHNVQSVQFLDKVERKGTGWNLCLQTLDGILCHDGEVHDIKLSPHGGKTFAGLDEELAKKKGHPQTSLVPMTLEGCVVRMADTVAYIGRDIEDAIRLDMIRRSDLPAECVRVLGDTNGTIVYTLVTDLIRNSMGKPRIAFGAEISAALKKLKAFNYERIYLNPLVKKHSKTIKSLFELLFESYLADVGADNRQSVIFTGFLDRMAADYTGGHTDAEIVRDFIAGMTDRFFLRQCPARLRPGAGGG